MELESGRFHFLIAQLRSGNQFVVYHPNRKRIKHISSSLFRNFLNCSTRTASKVRLLHTWHQWADVEAVVVNRVRKQNLIRN